MCYYLENKRKILVIHSITAMDNRWKLGKNRLLFCVVGCSLICNHINLSEKPIVIKGGEGYIMTDFEAQLNELLGRTKTIKSPTNVLPLETDIKEYNKPSLKEKYYKFIKVAANHMVLFALFIPVLTEMGKNIILCD